MNLLRLHRAAHASPVAIALLVVANLVPLAGVLFLGWSLITLLALYWLENGVVGVYAFGKIATAEAVDENPGRVEVNGVATPPAQLRDPRLARAIYLPFFVVHYGLFWVAHGVFVLIALPLMFTSFSGGAEPTAGDVVAALDLGTMAWALLVLVISHGASFLFNWLWGGERLTSTPAAQMMAPYGRVVVLHVTIVIGAFVVAILGQPIGALLVLVVLKTIADLAGHLAERRHADERATATGVTLTRSAGRWSISG